MATFTFHADPGHAWLEVTLGDLRACDMWPDQFSRCSYVDGATLYLEEDCDAGKFLKAWETLYGPATIEETHTNRDSFIRRLAPNG